jgi:hypothetical protein
MTINRLEPRGIPLYIHNHSLFFTNLQLALNKEINEFPGLLSVIWLMHNSMQQLSCSLGVKNCQPDIAVSGEKLCDWFIIFCTKELLDEMGETTFKVCETVAHFFAVQGTRRGCLNAENQITYPRYLKSVQINLTNYLLSQLGRKVD